MEIPGKRRHTAQMLRSCFDSYSDTHEVVLPIRWTALVSWTDMAQRAFAGANTIGTLLMHVAEAELFWMQAVIKGEALSREQREEYRFDVFGRPDAPQMEPRDVGYFRIRLERVRVITRSALKPLADTDIDALRPWEDVEAGEKRDFSVRWILNHLLEHESHHRGQILLLKSALGF